MTKISGIQLVNIGEVCGGGDCGGLPTAAVRGNDAVVWGRG